MRALARSASGLHAPPLRANRSYRTSLGHPISPCTTARSARAAPSSQRGVPSRAYTAGRSGAVGNSHVESDLGFADVQRAATLARISGCCYAMQQEGALVQRLESLSFELLSTGRTPSTRWFLARGKLPVPTYAGGGGASPAGVAMREEIVGAFRGIKWTGDSDVDAVRTWRGLSDFWPTEFHPDLTSPRGELVAHRGLTRMVDELSDAVLPALPRDCACAATPVRNGNGNGSGNGGGAARGAVPLALTGHSMGGAMALMLAAELQLLQRVGGNNISAHGFGSPSVIAHAREGPSAALRALGLPAGALRSFVVDNDPIPRAFLQADPVWALVKKFPPARGLLALRDAIGGAGGVMSSTRFLFDPVGELYLLSRDQSDTVRLTSLSHETVEEALDLALGQLQSDPLSALQAVWDHHHHSYAAELAGVAAAVQRRMRAAEGGRS